MFDSSFQSNIFHLDVSLPHAGQIPPDPRHEDGGNQREGNKVEKGWLRRVHHEQGDKRSNETQYVS